MIVFKNYFKIVRGHFTSLLIYIGISLLFVTVFLLNNNSSGSVYETSKPDIAVVDRSDNEVSQALVKYLDENANIKDLKEEDLDDELFYESIKAIITIPENFDFNKDIEYKSLPSSKNNIFIQQNINEFLSKLNTYHELGYATKDAISNTFEDFDTDLQISFEGKNINTDESSQVFFNFLSYSILSIIFLVVCNIMLTYNQETISKRNRVSSEKSCSQTLQLMLGHLVTAITVWLFFIILYVVLTGADITSKAFLAYVFNSFIFTISTLTMVGFISRLIKNENVIQSLLNVISLSSAFLTGAFVPQELLGDQALAIGRIFPSFYYIRNNIMISEGATFKEIIPNILIMLIFSVVFVVLAVFVRWKRY